MSAIPADRRPVEFFGETRMVRAMSGGAAFLDISFNGDGASPAVGEEVTLAAATLPNHQESSGLPIEEHVQRIVESTVCRLSGQMWKQGANPPGLPAGIWRVIDEVCG